MSEDPKKKSKSKILLEQLPPEIKERVEETIERILTMTQKKGKTRINEHKRRRSELERILEDMLHLDPQELSEYTGDEEFIGAMICTLYYVKKIATTRPQNINSKLIMYYFRTIDAIAAMLVEMIKNARGMVLERTIQIKQAAVMRENPLEELERLETILIMLDGLRKHIKNIIDEMDT